MERYKSLTAKDHYRTLQDLKMYCAAILFPLKACFFFLFFDVFFGNT